MGNIYAHSKTEKIIGRLLMLPLAFMVSGLLLYGSFNLGTANSKAAAAVQQAVVNLNTAAKPAVSHSKNYIGPITKIAAADQSWQCPQQNLKNINSAFSPDVQIIFSLTNQDRQNSGDQALCYSQTLANAAQDKASDMAAQNYFAHVNPQGKDMVFWLEKEKFAGTAAGENLAVNYIDASQVEQAWMNSEHHRENILNPYYNQIGIGMAAGQYQGYQTLFVVAYYGQNN